MISKKQVAEIRNFFDNYETNMKALWEPLPELSSRYNDLCVINMTTSKSVEYLDSHQHSSIAVTPFSKLYLGENQSNQVFSKSTPNLPISSSGTTSTTTIKKPLGKCFYLPEEKIHSNELGKIRQHFDKSYDKQESTSGISICDSVIAAVMENQNKIGKTKNNKNLKDSLELKKLEISSSQKKSTSLNVVSDQKISQSNDAASGIANKINDENTQCMIHLPPIKPALTVQIVAPTIIKSNKNEMLSKCGEYFTDQQANASWNWMQATSIKPIKSLITSAETFEKEQHQQQQTNMILMNDDCKYYGKYKDEQLRAASNASISPKGNEGECGKNECNINEISTTYSKINRRNNLNLDLFFDKEMSALMLSNTSSQKHEALIVVRDANEQNDNEIAITHNQVAIDCSSRSDKQEGIECNSTKKLSNEMISDRANNYYDVDSLISLNFDVVEYSHGNDGSNDSSDTSTSCTINSEIDLALISNRNCQHTMNAVATSYVDAHNKISSRRRTFTDGQHIYGPYDFDLFSNEFYQFENYVDDKSDGNFM